MKRRNDKGRAIAYRKRGKSYSFIKQKLNVSKSTLSLWLRDMPLSREQINMLRAHSPVRIEKFRNTMRMKREARLASVHAQIAQDLGVLSAREIFIAGLFLYWGEGGKTKNCSITLANTDARMIIFYLKWLDVLAVPKSKIRIRLHLYSDMSVKKEVTYWANILHLKQESFTKPYIKKSKLSDLSYRGFGHGTCNVVVDNRDINERVLQGVHYIAHYFQ